MPNRTLILDNTPYTIQNDSEFRELHHPLYNNLKLYSDLDQLERLVGCVRDILESCWSDPTERPRIEMDPWTQHSYGGFLAHQLKQSQISVTNTTKTVWISLVDNQEEFKLPDNIVLAICPIEIWNESNVLSLHWKQNPPYFIHIYPELADTFQYVFRLNIRVEAHYELVFDYDNLLELVMIVKNAGDGFAHILEQNIPHIDRWTILDTGSTDNTVQIIRNVLADKVRGQLYQEPFIDFGTSRNRALELAGQKCKFVIMLDDTYYVKGDIRSFLNEIRSDQFADSFSLYINSYDVQYASNRLLKTQRNLKYMFKIHEVIQDYNNINVIIPPDRAQIHDEQSDYMQNRTTERKQLDLKLLRESIQEDPDNPRHWYYMAQTYVGMKDFENAYRFFLARVYHFNDGFLQEKVDACFEAARVGQFQLKRPWEEIRPLYEKAYALDPTRPDAIYFLGIKEYLDGNRKEAFTRFKQAFQIGYPIHAQYSLKPTLSFEFTPRFLTELSYEFKDFETGKSASELYLNKTGYDALIASWNSIFSQLVRLPPVCAQPIVPPKPILCIIADGNWTPWTGLDLLRKGLGGSETYIVEMASWIQRFGHFQVYVFCRSSSPKEDVFMEGVCYRDLQYLYSFLRENYIRSVLISRFSEYIPLALECNNVDNIFVVVHDLSLSGLHVPLNPPKLKQIFVLTEWHKEYFTRIFPALHPYTSSLHYGISYPNPPQLPTDSIALTRFIYSSFPNRGLLPLLQMWPRIRQLIPNASLDLFVDMQHKWTRENYPDMMKEIDSHLLQLSHTGITNHGWVSKHELYQYWNRAHIWLYPCIFQETFCLTALEAAMSCTLAITSDLAALQNTVADRGILIAGDPMTEHWQNKAMDTLSDCLSNPQHVRRLVQQNRQWAEQHTWENQARCLQGWLEQFPYEWQGRYEVLPHSEHPNAKSFLFLHSGTGYSILNELSRIPSSRMHEIDEIYVLCLKLDLRHILEQNLEKSPFGHRVVWIDGLRDIPVHKKFDVIAVDPLDTEWDTYHTCLLASEFLHENGKLVTIENEASKAFFEKKKRTQRVDVEVLHFVLYSPSQYYTPMYEASRTFYQRFENVKTFYYYFSDTVSEPTVQGDLLLFPGTEHYDPWKIHNTPGLFEKTLKAFEWGYKTYTFKYLVRSNISSLVDFRILSPMLRTHNVHYGGSAVLHFPPDIPFVRGICIIFSYSLIKRLVSVISRAQLQMTDDLGLAVLIQQECPDAYPPQLVFPARTLFVPNVDADKEKLGKIVRPDFHACYRFKFLEQSGQFNLNDHESRLIDLEQMKKVIEILDK